MHTTFDILPDDFIPSTSAMDKLAVVAAQQRAVSPKSQRTATTGVPTIPESVLNKICLTPAAMHSLSKSCSASETSEPNELLSTGPAVLVPDSNRILGQDIYSRPKSEPNELLSMGPAALGAVSSSVLGQDIYSRPIPELNELLSTRPPALGAVSSSVLAQDIYSRPKLSSAPATYSTRSLAFASGTRNALVQASHSRPMSFSASATFTSRVTKFRPPVMAMGSSNTLSAGQPVFTGWNQPTAPIIADVGNKNVTTNSIQPSSKSATVPAPGI